MVHELKDGRAEEMASAEDSRSADEVGNGD